VALLAGETIEVNLQTGDPISPLSARRYLSRPYRKGWAL
jgi:hypothetical protein